MRTLLREHRNTVAAAVLSVVLAGTLLQAIIRSDGYDENRVSLNNGSIWVTWNNQAGRLNLESRKIEVRVRDPQAKGGDLIDLAQSGSGIAMLHHGEVRPVDDATAIVDEKIDTAGDIEFRIGGRVEDPTDDPTAAVADPVTGRVWISDSGDWHPLAKAQIAKATIPGGRTSDEDEEDEEDVDTGEASEDDDAEPVAPLRLAVADDGSAFLHRAGTDEIHRVSSFDSPTKIRLARTVEDASLTTVGSTPVVIDEETGELLVGDRSPIDLTELGSEPVLQQPGPPADQVLVATDDGLWGVPLDGGTPRNLITAGGGTPAEPVWIVNPKGSCAYGAWKQRAMWGRWCQGDDDAQHPKLLSDESEKFTNGNALVFRVNHGRTVLNDMHSGANLLVDLPEPVVVDDWDRAEDRERTDEDEEDVEDDNESQKCSPSPPAPQAKGQTAGARSGFPIIVRVLEDAQADPCDTLTIELPDDGATVEGGTVAVVEDGAALQVTPDPDRTADIHVPYSAVGQNGKSAAELTVKIRPDDVNATPVTVDAETLVAAGSTRGVTHNVLHHSHDPDGDALTLLSVEDETTNASVRHEANGAITFVPPGNHVGPVKLRYTITDGREDGEAEGVLTVRVQPPGDNRPPTPRPDRATAFVGKTTSIDVLANDSDPDGDDLQLVGFDDDDADVAAVNAEFDSDGTVTFTNPETPGRFELDTIVSDGRESATARLVVTVLESDGNLPPVAVRDDVVARPEVPALVDLLANDHDPEGDLLTVTEITSPPDSGVSIELLEKRVARVMVPPTLTEPLAVPYQISDGSNSAAGVLVIRPLFASAIDQHPIAKDDRVTVNAGATAAVPVLRNDIDPEGEQLEIVEVQMVDDSQGMAFIQRDQLRIRPNVDTRGSMKVAYTISDPSGNQADAFVHVEVLDPETENRPPRSPEVEGRLFSGRTVAVKVPLLELDPDGDPVHIVGLGPENLPTRGTVTFTAEGFDYHGYSGATGSDEFDFIVSDGEAETVGTARLVIAEKPQGNRPPVAVPDQVRVAAGGERIIPVLTNDSDPDGDPLVLVDDDVEGLVQPPEGLGTAEIVDDGQAIRFHAPGDIGSEPVSASFSYGVTDGIDVSRGMVVVEIVPGTIENEPPTAIDDAMVPQLAGTTVEIDVLENDAHPEGDKDYLMLEVLDDPDTVNIGGGKLQVTLGDRSKQFVYEISDGNDLRSRALVTIPVVDELPITLETAELEMDAGEERTIDLAEYASEPIQVEEVLERTVRGVEIDGVSGTEVTLEADAEWSEGAGFLYVASSTENPEKNAIGAVRIQIMGEKMPPSVESPAITLPEGAVRELDLTRFVEDPDSPEHTFGDLRGTTEGIDAALTGSLLRIEAGLDAKGTETDLKLTVRDGTFEVPMTVSVDVVPNDRPPPVAVTDTAETDEDTPVEIRALANDSDPIGEGLQIVSAVVQPGEVRGTVAFTDETITYTPASGGFGVARIAYTISDASNRTATGMIEVRVYGRPGTPPAPSGTAENGLVRLQWQAPTRGGTPITGYLVRDVDSGRIHRATSTSLVIDGLTNGTPHRFQVAALNRVVTGEGDVRPEEWSAPSPQLIPDAAPPQLAAPIVEFRKDDNDGGRGGVLHVGWQPPGRYDGSPVKEYVVTVDPPDGRGRSEFRFDASTTSNRFTDLRNGTTHRFTVQARNDAGANATDGGSGLSPISSPGSETPAGVPSPARNVTAARSTDTRYISAGGVAEVSWEASADDGGDRDGLRYRIVSVPAGHDRSGLDGRHAQVTGLDRNTIYRFRVLASNKAGDSTWAESPDVNVGGQPVASSATMLPGDGRIRVTGKQGDLRGAGSARWEYSLDSGGYRTLDGNDLIPASNGTRYESVRLRVCNNDLAGEGERVACSEPVAATNPSNNGSRWVTPYGAAQVTGRAGSGADSGTITWTWNSQRDTETDPGGTSHRSDYGYDAPAPKTFTVRVRGQGGPWVEATSPSVTFRDRLDHTASIRVWTGGNAQGQPIRYPAGGECGPDCTYGHAEMSGYAPNTTYWLVPTSNMNRNGLIEPGFEGCIQPRIQPFTTDSNGYARVERAWWQGQDGRQNRPRTRAWVVRSYSASSNPCPDPDGPRSEWSEH